MLRVGGAFNDSGAEKGLQAFKELCAVVERGRFRSKHPWPSGSPISIKM